MTDDTCDAGLRWGNILIRCARPDEHAGNHEGTYIATKIDWAEDDRRTFHGDDPGPCPAKGTGVAGLPVNLCVLPLGHRGDHAF